MGALLHLSWGAAKRHLHVPHTPVEQERMWNCNRHQGSAQYRGDGSSTPTQMVTANQDCRRVQENPLHLLPIKRSAPEKLFRINHSQAVTNAHPYNDAVKWVWRQTVGV